MTTWKRSHVDALQERFHSLSGFFAQNLLFPIALAEVAQASDLERVARTLVTLTERTGTTTTLIRLSIVREVESYHNEVGSILRSNTFASKVSALYARRISRDFLHGLLGETVLELLFIKNSLEVDPSKLSGLGLTDEYLEVALEKHRKTLLDTAQKCFDRISSPEGLETLPPPIREICDCIVEAASAYVDEDALHTLLGGFIILRLFCPFLISPDSFGLVEPDAITPTVRRNLILVTKLLQNLANNIEFGEKEGYMIPLNSFVLQNRDRMSTYLYSLPVGGLNGPRPDHKIAIPVSSPKPFSESEMKDLLLLHSLLAQYGVQLIDHLQELRKTSSAPSQGGVDAFSTFASILEGLGEPFGSSKAPMRSLPTQRSTVARKQFDGSDSQLSTLVKKSKDQFILEVAKSVSQNALAANDFFFRGRHCTGSFMPVFYFISSRFQKYMLVHRIDHAALAFIVMKVMGDALDRPFCVFCDFSWISLTSAATVLFKEMEQFFKLFTVNQMNCCKEIYLIHPTALPQNLMVSLRAFVSFLFSKTQKCSIVDVHDWKMLQSYTKAESIELPIESQSFVAKQYQVVKVNSKGKKQNRAIKFTVRSFLNLENNTIKNEKRISEISCIHLTDSPPRIEFEFEESGEEVKKRRFHDHRDDLTRTYICESIQQRDRIMEDIVMGTLFHATSKEQEFIVKKVNDKGKAQARRFKLTRDSLLNVKGNEIRREWPFIFIESIVQEESVVWLNVKTEKDRRKIMCADDENACALVTAVEEGMQRMMKSHYAADQGTEFFDE